MMASRSTVYTCPRPLQVGQATRPRPLHCWHLPSRSTWLPRTTASHYYVAASGNQPERHDLKITALDLDALAALPVALPSADDTARSVQLGQLVRFRIENGPNQVSRENGKRRVVVTANVRGRDLGSFVADVQRALAAQVQPPPG